MKILGIDPGLNATGYGVIEHKEGSIRLIEAGVIETSPKSHISDRLAKIDRALSEVFETYHPSVMVLEKLYSHYRHPTTALLMGHARGIACLACGRYGVPLKNLGATKIKKALTGNGHASKSQIQRMVQSLLRLKKLPEPEDVADALAMAIGFIYIEASPFIRLRPPQIFGGLRRDSARRTFSAKDGSANALWRIIKVPRACPRGSIPKR